MKISELEHILKRHSDVLKSNIKLPEEIIDNITEKEGDIMKSKNVMHKIGFGFAALAAAFVLLVNCVPNIAYATAEIPVIGDVVRVVTFGRFLIKNNNYEANVTTPQIEGLLNKELEDKLNAEFKENSQAIIAAFEKDIRELEKEYGDDFHLGIDASYNIRTDNEAIIALDTYIANTVASSSTKHIFYNIDKKTGTLIELKDLFNENADYITPISEYIIDEMQKANEAGTGSYWIGSQGAFEGFERIKDNQNFFINDSGNIVICFDKYDVAPGAYGCPEFEIPDEIIDNIY